MRSSNPVLSRPDAFQPQNQAGYPQQAGFQPGPQQGQFGYGQPGYQQPGQPFPGQYGPQDPVQATRGVMTIDDVITKTAIRVRLTRLAS